MHNYGTFHAMLERNQEGRESAAPPKNFRDEIRLMKWSYDKVAKEIEAKMGAERLGNMSVVSFTAFMVILCPLCAS